MAGKPVCNLSDCDDNVFILAGRVSKALKRVGQADKAAEFYVRLKKCGSYEEALCLMMEYVEVE